MYGISKDIHQYDDIINLEHHVSATHPHMSVSDRAAQFSPFSALTGFDYAISETARLTDSKHEISESAANALNSRLQLLKEQINSRPEVTVTYFKPDNVKTGGAYISVTDTAKKIDEYNQILQLRSGTKIPIADIYEISGNIFKDLDENNF